MTVRKLELPFITILMASYNEEQSISSAILSIVNQTYKNWELIVIDDGSSDDTAKIVMHFQKSDNRIKLIRNKTNIGLAQSLNRGIGLSQGKYIARMDADDISYPERLQLQAEFLDAHSEIAVVGGNAELFDESGDFIRKTNMPISPQEIKRSIIKMNPMIHPSVMYRREFIQAMEGYDSKLRKKQDYDLWLRGSSMYQFANLKEVIIRYTIQFSKPLTTDMYGFYVRCLNACRQGNYFSGFFWAVTTLGINIMRKFGYKLSSYRKEA